MADNDEDDPLNLGSSLAFPIQADGKGGLAVVKGIARLENHFDSTIATQKGELVMRPSVGLDDSSYKAETPADVVAKDIKEAIINVEDGIEPASLRVEVGEVDSGRRPVRLNYRVKGDEVDRVYNTFIKLRDKLTPIPVKLRRSEQGSAYGNVLLP